MTRASTERTGQFVAYWHDETTPKPTPVATGATHDIAARDAILRVLGAGILTGSIFVQQRDDLPADDFASLAGILSQFFTERGSPRRLDA